MLQVFVFAELTAPLRRGFHSADVLKYTALMKHNDFFVPRLRIGSIAFLKMRSLQCFNVGARPVTTGNVFRPVVFIAFVWLPPTKIADSKSNAVVVPG